MQQAPVLTAVARLAIVLAPAFVLALVLSRIRLGRFPLVFARITHHSYGDGCLTGQFHVHRRQARSVQSSIPFQTRRPDLATLLQMPGWRYVHRPLLPYAYLFTPLQILLGERAHLIEFPSLLLPPGVTTGSIVNISVQRNNAEEKKRENDFWSLQEDILDFFGTETPQSPNLEVRLPSTLPRAELILLASATQCYPNLCHARMA